VSVVPDIERLKTQLTGSAPLDRLVAAADLAEQLRSRGDELLDQIVDEARASGSSWSEIGCALGTSKQAAHERFGALADPPPGQAPFGLTGTAADVLSTAADQARELGHHYVRPEHLVLAMLAQREELAAEVLAELGVTSEAVRDRVKARLRTGDPRPAGSLGIAPQTKRLLELARAIAKSLGHRCPKTEHILLAATSPKLHSSAAELLSDLGASPDQVRDQLSRALLHEAPELAERLRKRSRFGRIQIRTL
jgi:hypothetical protein